MIDLPLALGVTWGYARYVDQFNEKLLSIYREFQPDLVFIVRGSKIAVSSLQAMNASVRVIWCLDAVHRCDISIDLLRHLHAIFVFEASDVRSLEKYGLSAHFSMRGV